MPQKDYIKNKNVLAKTKNNEKLDIPSEVENEQQTNFVESLPKLVKPETFSLYVRGAAWIKDRDIAANKLKEICPQIHNIRYPRQKSANYCFVDFASAIKRDESFELLKKNSEVSVKPVTKDQPKLLEKRKNKVIEKREAKRETRKLLAKIKKNQKTNEKIKEKTNQIIIMNLSLQTTAAELKQKFTNAVKINLNSKKKAMRNISAVLTFPSPGDAFTASKQSITLHGQKSNVFLNTKASFKQKIKSKNKPPQKSGDEVSTPKAVKTKEN